MIVQNVIKYCFDELVLNDIGEYKYNSDGIILKLKLSKYPTADCVLIEIPGTAKIIHKCIQSTMAETLSNYEKSEGYFYNAENGNPISVIETELFFASEHRNWKSIKLGIPKHLYDISEKELYVVYDGVYMRLVYDDIVVNYNLPYGRLEEVNGKIYIDEEYISCAEYSLEIEKLKKATIKKELRKKLNYYTPFGHNTFIGDVMNFYHNGIYHMLYMPDTHHHGNRWGCGGHHFEHMITKDFITWEDVGPVWDVAEQWQTAGTGTMFFYDGKYYVSFGLHTGRMIDGSKLILPELEEYFDKNDESLVISFEEILKKGKYPVGAGLAVSDDGINFENCNIICGKEENPSIYANDEGLIIAAAENMYFSKKPAKPWKLLKKNFVSEGYDAPARNSSECPSFFKWNGYKYLIMGFTGFWRTEKDGDEYIEYATKGFDIYEGLNVPMAVRTDDNRVIMAGWLGGIGWGSCVVHRELIQYDDGSLGTKWMPELFPEVTYLKTLNETFFELPELKKSYYLEMKVKSDKNGRFAVRFCDENGEACELQLDFGKKQAQFATVEDNNMCEAILPFCEFLKESDDIKGGGSNINFENIHYKTKDFAIANVHYGNDEISLRIMIHYSKKMNSTIIDAEINKCRTLITNRVAFFPSGISVMGEETEARDVCIYEADI